MRATKLVKDRLKKLYPACHLCCPLSLCATSPLIEHVSFRAFQVDLLLPRKIDTGALHLIKPWLLSQRWLQLARMSFHLVMYVCLDLNDCSTETALYLPHAPLSSFHRGTSGAAQQCVAAQFVLISMISLALLGLNLVTSWFRFSFMQQHWTALCNSSHGGFASLAFLLRAVTSVPCTCKNISASSKCVEG